MLDFQDAGIGPVAYDLASLCETVRRDGGDTHWPEILNLYCQHMSNVTRADMAHARTILGAQRHLRILGIVTRLVQEGRSEKRACLPRVVARLNHLLNTEALAPVRQVVQALRCMPL